MPINSFDNYPMSWKPDRDSLTTPLYLSIANLLEKDIVSGVLEPNTKLPPQRELADYLDINFSTITRAYKICELKGLTYATTGRGTFVSPNAGINSTICPTDNRGCPQNKIEMGSIKPYYQYNTLINTITKDILNKPYSDILYEYGNPLGSPTQRKAAQKWLNRFQVDTSADNIIITSGSQNAFAITLISLFTPGDKIVTDPYTYPNFKGLANILHIQLLPVANDEYGMMPQALDALCKTTSVKGIYLMPACNNPTGTVITMERRKELAMIIKKHHLLLIEDGVYDFLSTGSGSPMISLVPDHAVYISGTSKPLCAGLRVAYLSFSPALKTTLERGIYNINLKTPALNVEIITELINSGAADKLIQKKIAKSQERNQIYDTYFNNTVNGNILSYFRWLPLPTCCNGNTLEIQARKKGVQVYSSQRFAIGPLEQSAFIRIAICSPKSNQQLKEGLSIIKDLIQDNQMDTADNLFIV